VSPGRGRRWLRPGLGVMLTLSVSMSAWTQGGNTPAPGEWMEHPNSKLASVLPSPLPDVGYGEPAAITNAWNGGTLDTRRGQLLVWGGGHADYGGNEVYAFRLTTRSWVRLTDPSPTTRATVEVLPDGRPPSRHTYSGLVYLPVQDRMMSVGGSLWWDGRGTRSAWVFDPEARTWERRADMPGSQLTAMAAYDPVTELVFSLQQNGDLMAYDAAKDTWTKHGGKGSWAGFDPARTMVIHPRQRKLLVVGGREILQFDLAKSVAVAEPLATRGGELIVGAQGPGLAYDPTVDRIVGWAGGGDVYSLDLATKIWQHHPATGPTAPPAPPRAGTYGRFQYVPPEKLYVLVNGIQQNVFLYRLAAIDGTR
jgi:hypothetical protein